MVYNDIVTNNRRVNMKRLNINLPDNVKEKMEAEKVRNGKPLNRIIVEALKKRYGLK